MNTTKDSNNMANFSNKGTTTTPDVPLPGDTRIKGAAATRRTRWKFPEVGVLVLVLIALCVYFSVTSPYFFAGGNLISILEASAITGIIAIPGTMLLIAGQFDLSVGSATAFCGVVMASLIGDHGALIAVRINLSNLHPRVLLLRCYGALRDWFRIQPKRVGL